MSVVPAPTMSNSNNTSTAGSQPVNIRHRRTPSNRALFDSFDLPSRSPLLSSLHGAPGTSPSSYSSYTSNSNSGAGLSCSPSAYGAYANGYGYNAYVHHIADYQQHIPNFERDFFHFRLESIFELQSLALTFLRSLSIHHAVHHFCSNFTCCGLALSDLHELLRHFEEVHVYVADGADSAAQQTQPPPYNPFAPQYRMSGQQGQTMKKQATPFALASYQAQHQLQPAQSTQSIQQQQTQQQQQQGLRLDLLHLTPSQSQSNSQSNSQLSTPVNPHNVNAGSVESSPGSSVVGPRTPVDEGYASAYSQQQQVQQTQNQQGGMGGGQSQQQLYAAQMAQIQQQLAGQQGQQGLQQPAQASGVVVPASSSPAPSQAQPVQAQQQQQSQQQQQQHAQMQQQQQATQLNASTSPPPSAFGLTAVVRRGSAGSGSASVAPSLNAFTSPNMQSMQPSFHSAQAQSTQAQASYPQAHTQTQYAPMHAPIIPPSAPDMGGMGMGSAMGMGMGMGFGVFNANANHHNVNATLHHANGNAQFTVPQYGSTSFAGMNMGAFYAGRNASISSASSSNTSAASTGSPAMTASNSSSPRSSQSASSDGGSDVGSPETEGSSPASSVAADDCVSGQGQGEGGQEEEDVLMGFEPLEDVVVTPTPMGHQQHSQQQQLGMSMPMGMSYAGLSGMQMQMNNGMNGMRYPMHPTQSVQTGMHHQQLQQHHHQPEPIRCLPPALFSAPITPVTPSTSTGLASLNLNSNSAARKSYFEGAEGVEGDDADADAEGELDLDAEGELEESEDIIGGGNGMVGGSGVTVRVVSPLSPLSPVSPVASASSRPSTASGLGLSRSASMKSMKHRAMLVTGRMQEATGREVVGVVLEEAARV
ncbi:hypothetical protein SCHPADRAFT_472703 [Schizopora paradoxa]|uniref:Uncharacterized protein n=1 Tax=Schizopora paradoxa TaxID=27342 RepID=A0A0H2RI01_9AGAM|nr:hypothetical protein SCHPADRAFT_472703 [Schizopora paradoxa]